MNNNTISFYNAVAAEYDTFSDNDVANGVIRHRVKQKLRDLLGIGIILDFGGGTGLDLEWMLEGGYKVIFCEPSPGMRQIAIDRVYHMKNRKNVLFLENGSSDFTNWQDAFPFSGRTDAILSNFAALNSINNLDLLFANLSQVIKSRGNFLALVLRYGHQKNSWWKIKNWIKRVLYNVPIAITIQYKDEAQTVYVHTVKDIKKAALPYFEIAGQENLFEFTLIHLVKKV